MQPAIRVNPRRLRLRRGMSAVAIAILLSLAVGGAWSVIADATLMDSVEVPIHGIPVTLPGWAMLVVAALLLGLVVVGLNQEIIPTWNGDTRVGWRVVSGGIELVGLRDAARGATLTIPPKAAVELYLHVTQTRQYGTITLYGVDVVTADDAELFDVELIAENIDVGPLVRALRARGHRVEVDPGLVAGLSPDPGAPALDGL